MALLRLPIRSAVRLLLGLLALVAVPRAVAGQGCGLGEGSAEFRQESLPGRGVVRYFRQPHFVCDDGVEIWSDSAVAYEAEGMSVLIGSVRYVDGARRLTSDQARYFSELGRLQAQGHVHVVNSEDGTSVENGDLVYLRQTPRRAEEEMTVTTAADGLRPRATVPPPRDSTAVADSAAGEAEPYNVVADRMVFRGTSQFNAAGTVEIERDSLFAYADSADYEEEAGGLLLVGSARVESSAYDLVGRTITLGGADSTGTSEVQATRDAVLTGEELRLTAPVIRLYLTDGAVQHLVAVPLRADSVLADSADATRPVALAEDFELTADSIDVTAPAQVVDRILAAGRARSESHAQDSLNVASLPPVARSDWLEGDTVIVFLTSSVPDSAQVEAGAQPEREYEVDRIVARVGARSLYRLLPEDSTSQAGVDRPAVHYVMGDSITIHMAEGEVEEMQVVGQTRGIHLEPLRAGAGAAEPDSTTVPAPPAPAGGDDPLGRRPVPDRAAPPTGDPGASRTPPGRQR